MATCSNIHAWKIPQTEEPGGLQSMGSLWILLSTHGFWVLGDRCNLARNYAKHGR